MGYLAVELQAVATLSRHNSDKDTRHDTLWLDFIKDVKHLANNPRYKEINLSIDADTVDMEGG